MKIEDMTVPELQEHLRQIRQRRTTDRPVAKAKAVKAEKKSSHKRMTAVEKLLAGMSSEDQAELMKSLESGNENAG